MDDNVYKGRVAVNKCRGSLISEDRLRKDITDTIFSKISEAIHKTIYISKVECDNPYEDLYEIEVVVMSRAALEKTIRDAENRGMLQSGRFQYEHPDF